MPGWLESGCEDSSGTGESFPGAYLVGCGASVCSSIGSSFGLVLQKKAHARNDAMIARGEQGYKVVGGLMMSPLWLFGFTLLVLVPLPFDFISLALAPASLITPLGGVTIILNNIAAPLCLGEKVTRLDWAATFVIVVGVAISTAFGVHCSTTYTGSELVKLYQQHAFIVCEVILCSVMIFLLWMVHMTGPEALTRSCCSFAFAEHDHRECVSGMRKRRWLAYAFLAGGFGANTNVFLKACGEMAENVFFGSGANDDYNGAVPYLLLVATAVWAVGQLMQLNMGAAIAPAVKYFPIYNVCLISLTTTLGLIYFGEYKLLSYAGIMAYPVGLLIVLFGIYMLTWNVDSDVQQGSPPRKTEASEWDGDGLDLEESKPLTPTTSTDELDQSPEARAVETDGTGLPQMGAGATRRRLPPLLTPVKTDAGEPDETSRLSPRMSSPAELKQETNPVTLDESPLRTPTSTLDEAPTPPSI